MTMKFRHVLLSAMGALVLLPLSVTAHDVANMSHSHAFEQTGYGQYRQGHSVNGPLGSIIIWSPRTQTGYQAGKTVKFARPTPITRPPGSPVAKTQSEKDPVSEYGKR